MAGDSVGDLRSDFDIYKTQIAVCGSCIGVILLILICALIYAFFLVRKLRNDMQAQINKLEATRRFTISRPKLYSSSDPTSKLQGEMDKVLKMEMENKPQPSPVPATPLSPNFLNPGRGYPNLNSPGLTSNYSNYSPVGDPRSPSNNPDRNINRIESFLNKTRQLYSPSRSDVSPSPRLPRTPTGNHNNKDNTVFKFS